MQINIKDSQVSIINKALKEQGLFVTSGNKPPNLMSTHWGSLGNFWNRWIFVLPVRYNKLSHDLILNNKEFTVSVPYKDLRYSIMQVDQISGRQHDKFGEFHLHPIKAKSVQSYIVGDCGLHLECKVVYIGSMSADDIVDCALKQELYSNKTFHTMFFGEVINIYETV